MIEISIIIPQRDNDGATFTAKEYASFEAEAVKLFGGISRLFGEIQGRWVDDQGQVDQDRSAVYVVAIDSIASGAKVDQLARKAKAIFRQKAIYIRYLGVAEII